MIPWFTIPDIPIIGPLGIHAFGVMVAAGVLSAIAIAKKRAPRFGVDPDDVDRLSTWLLVGGFVGAHLVDRLFYFPEEVKKNWLTLIELWNGLSSFGGLLGGAAGAVAWVLYRKKPFLPLADLVATTLPLAWMLGRIGCALVHDHPGILTTATNPLAVHFPDGPRYDLGLLEAVFWLFVVIGFQIALRKPRPLGTWLAAVAIVYGPARFGLDFLRVADARYAGLTPAQWLCIAMTGAGIAMAVYAARRHEVPAGAVGATT